MKKKSIKTGPLMHLTNILISKALFDKTITRLHINLITKKLISAK